MKHFPCDVYLLLCTVTEIEKCGAHCLISATVSWSSFPLAYSNLLFPQYNRTFVSSEVAPMTLRIRKRRVINAPDSVVDRWFADARETIATVP